MHIKIAFPTDDGETISRHFGSARYFQVLTVDDGTQTAAELREKGGHDHHNHDPHHEHGYGRTHPNAKFDLLHDCQVLIGAGMGQPAYERLQGLGLTVYLTGEKTIAAALARYQADALDNDIRRVHAHHDHDHGHEPNQDRGRQEINFVDKPQR
jgi:predicted Fe-Mo cluster-binding NifX family protein